MTARRTVEVLLDRYGTTYAAEAGIRLRNTPQPLYQLLVLSDLLSARIRASVAVAAARALFAHGLRSPDRMIGSTWQERVDALGEGGYRRYDERTATQLGAGAELLLVEYGGDLRRLRREADGDLDILRSGLRRTPGMGPAGADIFVREVQAVWPETAPFLDGKALQGAEKLGLPASPANLVRLAEQAGQAGQAHEQGPAELAAALVRAALDKHVVDDVAAYA
ncbi:MULTISPECIES: endonuclease [unclassified Streptomyces]|uniref:endonuclease n=1 Tax=unclassified Streptomyces TaxID=2593676 RepID=UPI00225AB09A|nr:MULTISPECIES: endonuclease [unclassified Streptomyces]WSP55712.1 endonuclease [Streptomyces sp. NBC_01241]WSU23552.1 endonuclease [Streptomyces sp. NBC_01108]MCX4787411.1 endonuclease [Streptomyces sp. NBC_01221]MCX4796804.1 endonuclease [Streptomyces sp. NBC_01242]WSJ38021.1 endonuclease [Streptomyces sp. NBC_01321]